MAKAVTKGAPAAKGGDPIKDALAQLAALGDEKVRARNSRLGAGDNQFGVPMGEIRKVAKKFKAGHDLVPALWATGNLEARLLATLLVDPAKLPPADLDRMVREATFGQLADWLNSYVVRNHPGKEALRVKWMKDKDPWAARAGWGLTSERIGKDSDGLDLPALLDRIEKEMAKAPAPSQWTMNFCLAGIGIHHPALRERAIAIGEKLGIYRDFPCSKGCTSPFAPTWITEMVRRAGG